ncbi:hypothetical protein GOBAR_DD11964 [Gossypium barbadense]|nr:hypothetical protein GOBAR_DD11964 [Gossypium barbadense]
MDVVLRHRCHILHPTRSVAQSIDVGREDIIDSVPDGGNARNRLGVAAVRVKATNFATTARPEGFAQGGHVGDEQHRLVGTAQGAHRGMRS